MPVVVLGRRFEPVGRADVDDAALAEAEREERSLPVAPRLQVLGFESEAVTVERHGLVDAVRRDSDVHVVDRSCVHDCTDT